MIRNVVKVLSDAEIERLHKESLQVLEREGLLVPNERVLKLCRKAGAFVDEAAAIVRISPSLMEQLLAGHRGIQQAPERPVQQLTGGISTQVFVVDWPGHVHRKGTLSGMRRGIMVSDG